MNETIFDQCIQKAKSIDPEICGLSGHRLKINTSFGPLKFDEPKLVVLHLMIYNIEGHRQHALASPFTCLDWERSSVFIGKNLKYIFPVGCLQPRDFVEARRGLDSYIKDLQNGTISIRDYQFEKNEISEVKRTYPLDSRHKGEFAYHIVRNLMLNWLKLKHGKNKLFSKIELRKEINELLGEENTEHVDSFTDIARLKEQRYMIYPEESLNWVTRFVNDFQKAFVRRWKSSRTVFFIRHARTSKNDGSFLGQRRNPGILPCEPPTLRGAAIKYFYSSPARRCTESVEAIMPSTRVVIDDRLREIDYGLAEGCTYDEIKDRHPEIIQAWSKGEDPYFPGGGENTSDVLLRLNEFIEELIASEVGSIGVMTHNVVLRCLIGNAHSIPKCDWHRLTIPHMDILEFKLLDGRLYSNIPRVLLEKIFAELG